MLINSRWHFNIDIIRVHYHDAIVIGDTYFDWIILGMTFDLNNLDYCRNDPKRGQPPH